MTVMQTNIPYKAAIVKQASSDVLEGSPSELFPPRHRSDHENTVSGWPQKVRVRAAPKSVSNQLSIALSLSEETKTTIPEVEHMDDGYMRGWGELAGDLLVGNGNVASSESPGTLILTGDTTFTSESTYEREASPPTDFPSACSTRACRL